MEMLRYGDDIACCYAVLCDVVYTVMQKKKFEIRIYLARSTHTLLTALHLLISPSPQASQQPDRYPAYAKARS